ncbi:MAG: hypothetical protein JXQ75_14425 [Phycisphaerae bacterium]|nr:hypothetical protein [Phycisphaerae bacterium]
MTMKTTLARTGLVGLNRHYPSNDLPFDMREKDMDHDALGELLRRRWWMAEASCVDFHPLMPHDRSDDAGLAGSPIAPSGIGAWRRRSVLPRAMRLGCEVIAGCQPGWSRQP